MPTSAAIHRLRVPHAPDMLQPVAQPRPLTPGERTRALAQTLIQPGAGEFRSATLVKSEKMRARYRSALKRAAALAGGVTLGAPVGAVAASVLLAEKAIVLIPRFLNTYIIQPSAEWTYRVQNKAMLAALEKPRSDSILRDRSLGSDYRRLRDVPGVLERLVQHARDTGYPTRDDAKLRKELAQMVAFGENLAEALQEPGGELLTHPGVTGPALAVPAGGATHYVRSNTYTTRALSWFMMAHAAAQDVERRAHGNHEASDMVTDGSIFLDDPGHRIYNFINSAATSCPRCSSHVPERSATEERHKLFGLFTLKNKAAQRGIEDYGRKLPGLGGSLLFDRMQGEKLFVKFETEGCPPYFQLEEGQGFASGFVRFFCALDRNVDHGLSFAYTRFFSHAGAYPVVRQEHVYKGVLRDSINRSFIALAHDAIDRGVIAADAKALARSVQKFGLPIVSACVSRIRVQAEQGTVAQGPPGASGRCGTVIKACGTMEELIERESNRLGFASDQHGIDRRGAETHTSITRKKEVRMAFTSAATIAQDYVHRDATGLISVKRSRAFAISAAEAADRFDKCIQREARDVDTAIAAANLATELDSVLGSGALDAAEIVVVRHALERLDVHVNGGRFERTPAVEKFDGDAYEAFKAAVAWAAENFDGTVLKDPFQLHACIRTATQMLQQCRREGPLSRDLRSDIIKMQLYLALATRADLRRGPPELGESIRAAIRLMEAALNANLTPAR